MRLRDVSGRKLAAEASPLSATKSEIVRHTRVYFAAPDRSANVGIAAQVLAFIERIPTISGSGAALFIPVIAISVSGAGISVPVIRLFVSVSRASVPLGRG
jgi:hypothetical protein